MKRRVLVVAAEQFELEPIRKAIAARSDLEFSLTANGPGPRLAGEAVDAAGFPGSYDAIVSTGLCGALIEELEVGQVVLGNAVNGDEISEPRCGPGTFSGPIISVDYVAGTVEERKRLQQLGGVAVEMEAAAVLTRARQHRKPFYCVKAVSDRAGETFELDLNAARDHEGRFSVPRILGQAILSPRRIVPELGRLRRNSRHAADSLGEFFAHCNF